MRRLLTALVLVLLAASCSKDKDVDRPAELVKFAAALRVDRAWSQSVGGVKTPLRLGLALAVDDGKVFASGHKGEVAAFDLASGRRLWVKQTKAPLGGGPGVGNGLVVVGSTDGDVIALAQADGSPRWHVAILGEILAPPAISSHAVVVRAVDGKLHGLALDDGHELWQLQQQVPALSLRGTSRPELAGDLVICGFDNGKIVAANSSDGSSAWEAIIAPPHGRTELERLVDIDSVPLIGGNDVYVVGFQGNVAMLALDTGQIWWSHEMSSYRGLSIDDDNVYVSTSAGDVVALHRKTGAEVWRQSALAHRGLTSPTVAGSFLVVADFQGYVHWLDKSSGAIVARARAGKVRMTNPPVAADDRLLVINDDGGITAFKTTPLAGKRGAAPPPPPPAPAPEATPSPEAAPAPTTTAPEAGTQDKDSSRNQ
jgi:outer membrane protein assembly factor BamB